MRISSIKVVICRTCRSVEADVRGEIADVHTSNCTRHKIYVYIKEGILKVHNNYINMSESESASLENQEWLCSVKPSKTIYFPQIGDHVVYVKQAHHDYLEEVKKRNLYRVEESDKPWSSMNFRELDVHEYVKVVEIKYVMQPLRLCCLKLELLSDKTSFTVRYRNLDRVTDFLVLRQIFDAACKRKWRSGHRLRRLIGKVWFYGQIISVQDYHHRRYPGSQYKRLRVEWNNGRLEEISPWEVEEISKSTHRLERDEWTYDTAIGDSVRCRILHGLGPLMKLDIAKPFLKLNGDLSYFSTANYPIDLQTIHDRLQNRFYRRVAAIRFDVEMLAVNIRELRERPVVILSFSMENNIFVICDAVTTKLLRIIEDANQNEASQSQTSTSQGAVGREPDRRATDGNDESDDNLSLADTVVESPRKRRRVCANREGTSSIIIRQSKTKSCEEIVINLPRRSSAKGKETRNYRSKNSGKRIIVCIVDNYEDKSEEDEDGEEDDSGDDQSDSTDDENAQENERTMNINRGRTNFPGIRAATTGGSQRRKCWTTESRFYDSEVQAGAKRRGRGHGTSRCNQFKADMALNTGNDVRAIKEMIQAAKNDLYKCLTETQHKLDCILQVVDTCLQQTTVNDQGVQTEPKEEPVIPLLEKKISVRQDLFRPSCDTGQNSQVTGVVGIPITANNYPESNGVTIGNNNSTQSLDPRTRLNNNQLLTGNVSESLKNKDGSEDSEDSSCSDDSSNDASEDSAVNDGEWLCTVRSVKSPYLPQLGDKVVYIQQCHKAFFEFVSLKKLYEIRESEMPWSKFNFKAHESAKVIEISYKRKNNIRICCLRLERIDDIRERTGKFFDVEYHYIKDHPYDFLILRQHFYTALAQNWKVGSRFRRMLGNMWYFGRILAVQAQDPQKLSDSKFECLCIQTDTGSEYNVSPWNIEPIDEKNLPEKKGVPIPVTPEDLRKLRYQPKPNEWHQDGRPAICRRIRRKLEELMRTPIAVPFVKLRNDPSYVCRVEYPIDLEIISARLGNLFYRRVDALEFDIRYLAKNFEMNEIELQSSTNIMMCLYYKYQATFIMQQVLDSIVQVELNTFIKIKVALLYLNFYYFRDATKPGRHLSEKFDTAEEDNMMRDVSLKGKRRTTRKPTGCATNREKQDDQSMIAKRRRRLARRRKLFTAPAINLSMPRCKNGSPQANTEQQKKTS
ncbi:uncharacterized protein LOC100678471 isoform X2 [Nasonia vitripennis]|uniref:Uncharacterized protein n=1 Tax=Nasonia vitripennis TaxID=7425 RepID=A0A7M7Q9H7_NASVI|nr:uncharacterized protein LOC100678471 isoform X2 [Nasonia vitripennis]